VIKKTIFFKKFIRYSALIICVILHAAFLNAGENNDYVQYFESGKINWTKGILQSKGFSSCTDKDKINGDIDTWVLEAAIQKGRRNLLKTIYKVRIDSTTLVEEIISSNLDIRDEILSMVNKAPVIQQKSFGDGTIEVTLEMDMLFAFSQLILPEEITQIATIKHVLNEKRKFKEETGSGSNQTMIPLENTGLVVMATGLDVLPSMAPKILDENGEQVYGSTFASRNFAVQYGMSAYVRDFSEQLNNQRVGKNPLVVRGVRTSGTGFSDIVISNADSSKIRSSSINLSFLKKCRVVIVLE